MCVDGGQPLQPLQGHHGDVVSTCCRCGCRCRFCCCRCCCCLLHFSHLSFPMLQLLHRPICTKEQAAANRDHATLNPGRSKVLFCLQMAEHGADETSANSAQADPSRSNPADEGDDCCPICSDAMTSPCRTACGHVFCSACLVHTFKMKCPWNRGPCPLCRAAASLYSSINTQTGQPLEAPDVTTIFGSVYLQGGSMGVASCAPPPTLVRRAILCIKRAPFRYHFESPDLCFIRFRGLGF